jgi:predicted amidohydrolase YtcJ
MRLVVLFFLAAATASADTLIHNVSGYTSTASGIQEFSALLISDTGRIVATGDPASLNVPANSIRIDGKGYTLLPGLADSHAHLYNFGFLTKSLNLAGTPSVETAVRHISDYAAAYPYVQWIHGRGWNQVLWPVQKFPTAADIDAAVADRPVWLRRIDGHAAWANSRAMEIAGIDDDTPDPVGGRIVRDAAGKATGVFVDNAMGLVESHIPGPTKRDIRVAYRVAQEKLLPLGLTSAHDVGIGMPEVEVLLSMADDDELDMRIYAMLAGAGAALEQMKRPVRRYGQDKLEIAAVKLYADGALGSRGAAMLEAYSDDPENYGLPFYTVAELQRFVRKANGLGFQVGIHAIGDLGNRLALDAFEAAQGGLASPLRNRIEHAQIIAPEDLPRFAELGVIASMQATHATSDMNMAEDRVGPERIKGGYAWRRLLDAGAILANGSDFPVELA